MFSENVLSERKASGRYVDILGPYPFDELKWVARQAGVRIAPGEGLRKNPPGGEVIYDNILSIEAEKGSDSLWPRERFRHDFKKGSQVIGLPNGDILVKSKGAKKKLWREFEYAD